MLKKKNNFLKIKNAIDGDLEKRKFNHALALYHKLLNEYNKLSEDQKISHQIKFKEIRDKLILLVKISELLQSIKTDNLEEIKHNLNGIELYYNLYLSSLPERFKTYIRHNFSHAYKVYHYKIYKVDLDKVIENIYSLVMEKNYENALNLFPKAMHYYNEMSRYYKNDFLLKDLENLKRHIKMSMIKERAISEEAEFDEKIIRQQLIEGKLWEIFGIKREKKIEKETPKIPEDLPPKPKKTKKKDITNLKKLIKKGEDKLSKREFEKIFGDL